MSLFACSLGAYFSLNTYHTYDIKKSLFLSLILDMEHLVDKMMVWYNIPEERLTREKEIATPIDLMTWDYYQYVKTHPVQKWDIPTSLLLGGKDIFQSVDAAKCFADKYGCVLTVAENSEHSFGTEKDGQIVNQWWQENI